ncbi:MAG: phycobiliprotein lyase [Prochlorococcus sp.]|jgi:phycoerythrin-associated linker protein
MKIEHFVAQSEGTWRSMRSSHSLAFQQFEEVLSEIRIKKVTPEEPEVIELLKSSAKQDCIPVSPFTMEWKAESDWESDDPSAVASGCCLLVPIPASTERGVILRSLGYAEAQEAISNYQFLSDGTFVLSTKYGQSLAEERIWFVSKHVRCRSSVIRTSEGSGVLQTSFASEVRQLTE